MQTLSTGYLFCKGMFLYMKGKAKYVKNLEDNLMEITAELGTYYSRKTKIDRLLEKRVFKEEGGEYKILQKQIDVFHERYTSFVQKYNKYWDNLPEFQVTDAESVTNVIDAMRQRKPTILTHKFFKLAKLSKEIKELHDRISRVTERMKEENVLRDKKVEPVQVRYDDIDLPSSTEHDKILRCLREDDNRSIGIWGPIGVGKTTIMQRLNNELKHSQFDVVICIDYQKQQTDAKDNIIEVIQDAIMGRLKLDREKAKSIQENADIISKALWDKKYILLIDQVTSTINLDEVGIHNVHKFGKVVVASSSRKVINTMTDQQVEIKQLSEGDALNLFQNVCGKINDRRIKLIAERIVMLCGGLPLVIKLVANYLKGVKDEEVWSGVKARLQSDTNKAGGCLKLGGVEHAYKLVYDKLEESHKKCLLFVTLFPSDHIIHKDNLVECWNAEGFLNSDIQELIRTAREDGAVALKELTDEYLLENSDKHVKMPVYFRKVAIQQEFPGEKDCLSWLPEKNIQHLNEVTWKKTKRMSLIGCETETTLPTSPKCDNISTLLMQNLRIPSNIPDLVELGDEFFRNMKNLRILDLNKTRIKSLPKSTTSLVSLICLYLNGCPLLTELPNEVNNLKKLELLDIQGTSIHSLPEEVGDMTQLRCLRISFSQKGCNHYGKESEVKTTIPDGIISRLDQLEELTIEVGCCSKAWDDIADKIATELATLEKLSTLDFHFPRGSSLEQFITKSKSLKKTDTSWSTNTFRSFNISVGCCKMQHPYDLNISGILAERQLRFSTKEEISSVGEVLIQAERQLTNEEISSIGEVLTQASSFGLVSDGVRNLSDFSLENFGALKVCVVGSCKNMTSIVDVSNTNEMHTDDIEESDCGILQCLEKLHLFDLKLLQCIWKGPVSSGSLANLKFLTLSGCPEITTILNYEQAKALSSLDHVKVEDCAKVVEIIEGEITNGHITSGNVDQSDILNKVTTIELVNLPSLQTLCTSTSMKLKSLVTIVFKRCSKDFDLNNLSNVEKIVLKIKCEESWWDDLKLSNEEKQPFHPRDFYVWEEDLSTGATHEGESSKQGGSADPLASDVSKCNGNNLMMSNINSVDHADKHKEANPGHQNSSESSEGVELVTHQSTNTNGSAKKKAFPLPEERCSRMKFTMSSH